MRAPTVAVVIACALLAAQVAQAQRLSALRSLPPSASPAGTQAPAALGAPIAWAQYSRGRTSMAFPIAMPDSGGVPQTHWVRGGLLGAAVFGVIGAGTALGLSGCRCVKDALLGFVPGAMIGFPIGALIGGQFPKRR